MSKATPKMRDFAERVIAYETKGNKSPETKIPGDFFVGEKLRWQLTTLMGNVGFSPLLSRALALANAEVPWLRAVHIKADGSLGGLHELGAQVDPDEILEGRVVLLAQLLGLLVVFIGEDLTLQLVREVWPKLSLNDGRAMKLMCCSRTLVRNLCLRGTIPGSDRGLQRPLNGSRSREVVLIERDGTTKAWANFVMSEKLTFVAA